MGFAFHHALTECMMRARSLTDKRSFRMAFMRITHAKRRLAQPSAIV